MKIDPEAVLNRIRSYHNVKPPQLRIETEDALPVPSKTNGTSIATDLENEQKSSNVHKWPWTSFISAILVSIISAAIIQIGIVSRWIGVTDAKIAVLDDLIKETRLHLSQIDAAGTRTIPVINEK